MSLTTKQSKSKSALDVAVNQLVRASVGGVPSSVCDDDLDKYVADLILKEASTKNKLYNKEGIRAYLPHSGVPPCSLPKTNKRFLSTIVKSVDNHNQALIKRTEEDAAARMRSLNHLSLRRRYSGENCRRNKRRSRREESYSSDNSSSSKHSESDSTSEYESLPRERERRNKHKKYMQSLLSSPYDSLSESDSDIDIVPKMKSDRYTTNSSTSFNQYRKQTLGNSKASSSILLNKKALFLTSSPANTSTSILHRGRGQVSDGSKMDKYFKKDYDPVNDVGPYIGENGWFNYDAFEESLGHKTTEVDKKKKKKNRHKEKSKHKKKHHKSKSKRKRRQDSTSESSADSDSYTNSDTDTDSDSRKKRKKAKQQEKSPAVEEYVREWDKPKLASGSWDLDRFTESTTKSSTRCPW